MPQDHEKRQDIGLPSREEQQGFFARYWFWMLLPLLLILAFLAFLVFGEESDAQFIYSFW